MQCVTSGTGDENNGKWGVSRSRIDLRLKFSDPLTLNVTKLTFFDVREQNIAH